MSNGKGDVLLRWSYYVQLIANVVALGVLIAVMLVVQTGFAKTAEEARAQNAAVLRQMAGEINTHAQASADRSCASAKGILYLLRQSPELDPRVERKYETFVDGACRFVPVDRDPKAGAP